ncbi:MAG: hypothetical protein QF362_04615 [Candidatus Woesearchaeota archaeon]|jgi:hypothetical protein|nr:hypothetical protein [Candidatus Woesearchaeota archaeon]MDP7506695.1 hypothetical protein [Candidatus Woesearchaeota archaeon]
MKTITSIVLAFALVVTANAAEPGNPLGIPQASLDDLVGVEGGINPPGIYLEYDRNKEDNIPYDLINYYSPRQGIFGYGMLPTDKPLRYVWYDGERWRRVEDPRRDGINGNEIELSASYNPGIEKKEEQKRLPLPELQKEENRRFELDNELPSGFAMG